MVVSLDEGTRRPQHDAVICAVRPYRSVGIPYPAVSTWFETASLCETDGTVSEIAYANRHNGIGGAERTCAARAPSTP
jgi:hypothetical protein